jgi:hypothetical protein
VITRGAGQFTYEVLFDHSGTPTDPSDDVFLDFLRLVRDTGRNPDRCAAIIEAIG